MDWVIKKSIFFIDWWRMCNMNIWNILNISKIGGIFSWSRVEVRSNGRKPRRRNCGLAASSSFRLMSSLLLPIKCFESISLLIFVFLKFYLCLAFFHLPFIFLFFHLPPPTQASHIVCLGIAVYIFTFFYLHLRVLTCYGFCSPQKEIAFRSLF